MADITLKGHVEGDAGPGNVGATAPVGDVPHAVPAHVDLRLITALGYPVHIQYRDHNPVLLFQVIAKVVNARVEQSVAIHAVYLLLHLALDTTEDLVEMPVGEQWIVATGHMLQQYIRNR